MNCGQRHLERLGKLSESGLALRQANEHRSATRITEALEHRAEGLLRLKHLLKCKTVRDERQQIAPTPIRPKIEPRVVIDGEAGAVIEIYQTA